MALKYNMDEYKFPPEYLIATERILTHVQTSRKEHAYRVNCVCKFALFLFTDHPAVDSGSILQPDVIMSMTNNVESSSDTGTFYYTKDGTTEMADISRTQAPVNNIATVGEYISFTVFFFSWGWENWSPHTLHTELDLPHMTHVLVYASGANGLSPNLLGLTNLNITQLGLQEYTV